MTATTPRAAAGDIVVRRQAGRFVVVPDSHTGPSEFDAVLGALAYCPPDAVVLDLNAAWLTGSMLGVVHACLCGPDALAADVRLVAARASSRRRLAPLVGCRGAPLYPDVEAAIRDTQTYHSDAVCLGPTPA